MKTISDIAKAKENVSKAEELLRDAKECLERAEKKDSKLEIVGYYEPSGGDDYFSLHGDGFISQNCAGPESYHLGRRNLNNCFKIREQAQQALDRKLAYAKLVRIIAEVNHKINWVCDWKSRHQKKCRLLLHSVDGISDTSSWADQVTATELYFPYEGYVDILTVISPEEIKLALGF